MRALLPYLALYKRHKWMLSLGIVLAIVTLLASIGLLTLSGWFLSASAVAGVAGLYSFNYMLPAAGVRVAASAHLYLQQIAAPLPCRTGALSSGRIAQPRGGGC